MRELVWLVCLVLILAGAGSGVGLMAAPIVTVAETVKAESAQPSKLQPVVGSVVNEEGKPVPGARVYVYGSSKETVQLVADSAGKFTYRPPAGTRGSVTLVAVAPGYSYCQAARNPGKPLRPMVLRREKVLRGVVVDEAGKPLQGVQVSLEHAWGWSRSGESQFSLSQTPAIPKPITDENGAFSMAHMPDPAGFDQWSINLRFTKPGRAEIRRSLEQSELVAVPKITLPVAGVLEGKLLLPDRTGPPPGEWTINLVVADKWGTDSKSAQTAKDGSFRIANMPPGSVGLAVFQPQRTNRQGKPVDEPSTYVLPTQRFVLKPGETRSIELVMSRAAVITGTVVDAKTGKPIQGAELRTHHSGHLLESYGESITTDETGTFSIAAPAGEIETRVVQINNPSGNYHFLSDDGPQITLKLAEGEHKTAVVLKVDTSDAYSTGGESSGKIPQDFELVAGTYSLEWDPDLSTSRIYTRDKPKSPESIKALVKKLPEGLSKKAEFGAQRLDGIGDDGLVCYIADEDRLYIDANRNWDLSDDTPIEFTSPKEKYRTKRLEWVEVQSRQGPPDGQHTTHPVSLRANIYLSSGGRRISFERKGAWKGVLETNKGKAEFALVDFDCNGVYGDRRGINAEFLPTGAGDMLAIDAAARGKVNATYSGSGSAFWFEDAARVGSKFYDFRASNVGDSLTVKPFTGPFGQLEVKVGTVQGLKGGRIGRTAYLLTPSGLYECEDSEPPFTVPAGKCRVWGGEAVLDSASGHDVNIRYSTRKPVEIRPDKTTELEITGALSLALEPDKPKLTWVPGETTDLTWFITIGDSITVDAIGDQRTLGAPVIKLFGAKGNMAAKTNAGYT